MDIHEVHLHPQIVKDGVCILVILVGQLCAAQHFEL